MQPLITSLKREHKRMANLLTLLEQEMDSFKEGEVLDYLFVSSILEYLTRTVQHKHHAIEDEIFRKLLVRDPAGATTVGKIREEHDKLAFLSDALKEAVGNVERSSELPRMWFVSIVNEYKSALWLHMKNEEKVFFPLAEKRLNEADWTEISSHTELVFNTEFDINEFSELNMLRNEILNWNDGKSLLS
ncbi:MAG: hemerythrin domain-containing protein [Sneathiella sp.]